MDALKWLLILVCGAAWAQVTPFIPQQTIPGNPTNASAAPQNIPMQYFTQSENCYLVATANVASLSGLPFIDGINGIAGQCILLRNQSTASQNGPWVMNSGAWTRPTWYTSGATLQAIPPIAINITQGISYQGTTWLLGSPQTGTFAVDSTTTGWFQVLPYVVSTGSTTGRSLQARGADVANVLDYGAHGNTIRYNYGNSAGSSGINCTTSSTSVTLNNVTIPSNYGTANILLPGCGNPGAVNSTNPGGAAVITTFSAPGTGYVPNSLLTCSGGTFTTACALYLYSTTVVSATVAAAGSGCTSNGTQTVTGTTGVAGTNATTYFTASVTVTGNAVASVNSITTGGTYYTNPTTITAEPVTGDACVGAQLSVVMGANNGTIIAAGNYTSVPANPVGFTSGSGTGAQVTFGSGPYWYGNPLVTTISGVVNSGGNSSFTTAIAASSTETFGLGKVYLWLNDDEPGIAAAIASGKQTIVFPSPTVVPGWEAGYTLSTGVTLSAHHRWDFNCQGNFISGANASSVGTAMVTVNVAPVFRAQEGSIIHNCEFDATGNFARNLTVADWNWIVDNNSFLNASTINVAWEYSSKREGYLTNFYIFNDGYNPLTLPEFGIDSESLDSRIFHGTIEGIATTAINGGSGANGDVHYEDVHAYGVLAGPIFSDAGGGNYWIANIADDPAPGQAGYSFTAGYNHLVENYYQSSTWAGQVGYLFGSSSTHNYVYGGGMDGGNNTPLGYSCIDNTTGTTNTFSPAPYGCFQQTRPIAQGYIVSALPACTAATKYMQNIVIDANAPTYNGTLTGGSSTITLAFCNGTNWTAH
jgi:hypothetical protein